MAVLSELHCILEHPKWYGDRSSNVAVHVESMIAETAIQRIEQGHRYVVTGWRSAIVVTCYASPNIAMWVYERQLQEIAVAIDKHRIREMLIAGDFNAKSTMWGFPRTTARGDVVMDWAASMDIRLVNRGSEATCVRWNRNSIVDLMWASSLMARKIKGWRVRTDVEFLSDHLYITMAERGSAAEREAWRTGATRENRWA